MAQEIVMFDTEAMRKRIAGVVHAQLAEMIPQAAVDALVKEEEAAFLKNILPQMVQDELKKRYAGEVSKYVNSPEFQSNCSGRFGPEPSEAVKQIIRELSPELVTAIFGEYVQRVIQDLRNRSY